MRFILLLIWFAALGLVAFLSLSLQILPPAQFHIDKASHMAAYMALAFLPALALRRTFWALAAGLILILFGLTIEGLQIQIPTRTPSQADALANIAGVLVGWIAGRWARRRFGRHSGDNAA